MPASYLEDWSDNDHDLSEVSTSEIMRKVSTSTEPRPITSRRVVSSRRDSDGDTDASQVVYGRRKPGFLNISGASYEESPMEMDKFNDSLGSPSSPMPAQHMSRSPMGRSAGILADDSPVPSDDGSPKLSGASSSKPQVGRTMSTSSVPGSWNLSETPARASKPTPPVQDEETTPNRSWRSTFSRLAFGISSPAPQPAPEESTSSDATQNILDELDKNPTKTSLQEPTKHEDSTSSNPALSGAANKKVEQLPSPISDLADDFEKHMAISPQPSRVLESDTREEASDTAGSPHSSHKSISSVGSVGGSLNNRKPRTSNKFNIDGYYEDESDLDSIDSPPPSHKNGDFDKEISEPTDEVLDTARHGDQLIKELQNKILNLQVKIHYYENSKGMTMPEHTFASAERSAELEHESAALAKENRLLREDMEKLQKKVRDSDEDRSSEILLKELQDARQENERLDNELKSANAEKSRFESLLVASQKRVEEYKEVVASRQRQYGNSRAGVIGDLVSSMELQNEQYRRAVNDNRTVIFEQNADDGDDMFTVYRKGSDIIKILGGEATIRFSDYHSIKPLAVDLFVIIEELAEEAVEQYWQQEGKLNEYMDLAEDLEAEKNALSAAVREISEQLTETEYIRDTQARQSEELASTKEELQGLMIDYENKSRGFLECQTELEGAHLLINHLLDIAGKAYPDCTVGNLADNVEILVNSHTGLQKEVQDKAALKEKLTAVESSLAIIKSAHELSEQKLQNRERDLEALRQRAESNVDRHAVSTAKVGELQDRLETTRDSLRQSEKVVENLTRENDTLRKEIKNVEEKNIDCERKLTNMGKNEAELTTNLVQKERIVANLRDRVETLEKSDNFHRARVTALTKQEVELRAEMERSEDATKTMKERVALLEKQLSQARLELSTAIERAGLSETEQAALKSSLELLSGQLESSQKYTATLASEKSALEQQLTMANGKGKKAVEKMEAIHAQLEGLKSELKEATSARDRLASDLQKLQSEKSGGVNNALRGIDLGHRRSESGTSEQSVSSAIGSNLQREFAQQVIHLQNQVSEKGRQNEVLQQENKSFKKKLDATKWDMHNLLSNAFKEVLPLLLDDERRIMKAKFEEIATQKGTQRFDKFDALLTEILGKLKYYPDTIKRLEAKLAELMEAKTANASESLWEARYDAMEDKFKRERDARKREYDGYLEKVTVQNETIQNFRDKLKALEMEYKNANGGNPPSAGK